jgi:hypothetical protein
MITETDEVERAIDDAALAWPELGGDRGALLRRLIEQGADVARTAREERRRQRRQAIRESSGMLTGVYPPGAAQSLREEWPE